MTNFDPPADAEEAIARTCARCEMTVSFASKVDGGEFVRIITPWKRSPDGPL
jgi:hypothetical protein